MKKLVAFALLSFCLSQVCAGNISITFITPQANQPYGSSLAIEVSVTSTFQVTTVTAVVNGNQTTLVYESLSGTYNGNLSLAGLPEGISYQLTVIATDIFNSQQPGSINFIYANPPVINVTYPLSWSNASPSLPVKISCTGIDTSTLRIKIDFGFQHVFDRSFSNSIDTNLQLQPSSASYGVMYITATDRWGQVTYKDRIILFDSNPFLSEIYKGEGKIFDFNFDKVLAVNELHAGKIVDVHTNDSTLITYGYLDNEGLSYLTPYGALYGQDQNVHPYDWNNGILYYIGDANTSKIVHTSGEYATWQRISGPNQTEIYLRNLATHSDQVIGTFYEYFEDNDVASNGVVVYRNEQFNIIKYKNGTLTTITSNNSGSMFNKRPLTDGNYVVYLKEVTFSDYSIYLHNGISEIQLSSLGPYNPGDEPQPWSNYQVNNKFVAYNKLGTSGQLQVWLRDSTGVNSQVTFFNTSSTIELLNAKGDIIYENDGIRYFAKKGVVQVPRPLGAAFGKVYYRDSSWYVTEGRQLYKLLVNAFVTVANGNWNDPSVWENNMVPPSNADVIILNNLTANVNVTCNSLHVSPPGSITVLTGVTLTVLH